MDPEKPGSKAKRNIDGFSWKEKMLYGFNSFIYVDIYPAMLNMLSAIECFLHYRGWWSFCWCEVQLSVYECWST